MPTSDIQFLAEILLRVVNQDQVTTGDLNRLRVLRDEGHSTVQDQVNVTVSPTLAPHATDIAIASGATRVAQ